jgi:hypothetical protein
MHVILQPPPGHIIAARLADVGQQLAAAEEALQSERAAHSRLQADAAAERGHAAADRVRRGPQGWRGISNRCVCAKKIAGRCSLLIKPQNTQNAKAELERSRADCRALNGRLQALEAERSGLATALGAAEAAAGKGASEAVAARKKAARLEQQVAAMRWVLVIIIEQGWSVGWSVGSGLVQRLTL